MHLEVLGFFISDTLSCQGFPVFSIRPKEYIVV